MGKENSNKMSKDNTPSGPSSFEIQNAMNHASEVSPTRSQVGASEGHAVGGSGLGEMAKFDTAIHMGGLGSASLDPISASMDEMMIKSAPLGENPIAQVADGTFVGGPNVNALQGVSTGVVGMEQQVSLSHMAPKAALNAGNALPSVVSNKEAQGNVIE